MLIYVYIYIKNLQEVYQAVCIAHHNCSTPLAYIRPSSKKKPTNTKLVIYWLYGHWDYG